MPLSTHGKDSILKLGFILIYMVDPRSIVDLDENYIRSIDVHKIRVKAEANTSLSCDKLIGFFGGYGPIVTYRLIRLSKAISYNLVHLG